MGGRIVAVITLRSPTRVVSSGIPVNLCECDKLVVAPWPAVVPPDFRMGHHIFTVAPSATMNLSDVSLLINMDPDLSHRIINFGAW